MLPPEMAIFERNFTNFFSSNIINISKLLTKNLKIWKHRFQEIGRNRPKWDILAIRYPLEWPFLAQNGQFYPLKYDQNFSQFFSLENYQNFEASYQKSEDLEA